MISTKVAWGLRMNKGWGTAKTVLIVAAGAYIAGNAIRK